MKKNILADFHVHTNFSDGFHSLDEVVDLYGLQGFGAIAITDHICEETTWLGRAAHKLEKSLNQNAFSNYLESILAANERALKLYNMLVIPGFEISKNSLNNHRSAHILGLGINAFVSADASITSITNNIREQGGITIAAHPVWTRKLEMQTFHLWDNKEELSKQFDAWEVASGRHFFQEVQQSGLPMLATGDLHHRKQLSSWKTSFHCELKAEALFEAIQQQNLDFSFYKEFASYDYKKYLSLKNSLKPNSALLES